MGSTLEYDIMALYCKGIGINLCCQHTRIADSIGVDADPNARAATVVCDVRALPFRTGSLDYVICHHGLEHIRDAPLYVIHEWFRVLKENGTLAILVPDGSYGISALNYASFTGELTEYGHGHLFTLQTLSNMVSFAGGIIRKAEIIGRESGNGSIIVAAEKSKCHTTNFQPFSKPVEVFRMVQKNGLRHCIKRFLWRLRCG